MPINYEYAFQEIRVGVIQKKTLNSSWVDRYFVLTPVRLIYYGEEDRK